jgi:hypothetical protein
LLILTSLALFSGVYISYAATPELDTISEREEKVGNKWVSGLFFLLGLKYPIAYIHQTNVLRNNTKLFAVGQVYDMSYDPVSSKRDHPPPSVQEQESVATTQTPLTPILPTSESNNNNTEERSQLMLSPFLTSSSFLTGSKPFIITRLTEQEIVSQFENRGRTWQKWSIATGVGGAALLMLSLFASSSSDNTRTT